MQWLMHDSIFEKKAHLHDDDYDELVQSGMSNENNKTHVYKKHITKN